MQSLPDDVIREIFELCKAENIIPSILTPNSAPILLTHVCRRWRKIAHSTSRLWSSLAITFRAKSLLLAADDQQRRESLSEDMDAMRRWLTLSSSSPLSIKFHSSPLLQDCGQEEVKQFFNFLMTTSGRWRKLYFSPGHEQGLPADFSQAMLSINLPHLDTLEFGDFAHAIRPNSVLLRGQRLHAVSYRCSTRDWSSRCPNQLSHLNIRWSQLTSLNLFCGSSHHPLNDYFVVARRCSSLVSLSVAENGYHQRTSLADDMAPVLLPHLQSLSIRMSPEVIQTFFRVLNTPSLEGLSFRWNYRHSHPPDTVSSSLFSFLTRSGLKNKIKSLTIDPIHFTKPTFEHLIGTFPFLEALTLRTDFDRDTQQFVRPLAVPAAGASHSASYIDDSFVRLLSGMQSRPSNRSQAATSSLSQRRVGERLRLPHPMPAGNLPVLLPRLIRIQFLTHTQFSEDAILSFVEARRPLSNPGPGTSAHSPSESQSYSQSQSPYLSTTHSTPAVLRHIAFVELEDGHLGASELLRSSSVMQRLQPFMEDGLVVDVRKYYDEDVDAAQEGPGTG